MNALVFSNGAGEAFFSALLKSKLETAGLVLAVPVRVGANNWRLLVQEAVVAPEWAYARRSGAHIELRADFIAPLVKKARHSSLSVILTHTHPWDGLVSPSTVDLAGERVMRPFLFGRVPTVPHGRLIIGQQGYHAAVWEDVETDDIFVDVWDIGGNVVRFPKTPETFKASLSFDRQVRAFGTEGQRAIEKLTVGIVGLGGIGSVVAQELAHLGVRDFILIDPDKLETTNLNRVVGSKPHFVGDHKVDVVAEYIRNITGYAKVERIMRSVLYTSVSRRILDCDLFFCCTDSHGSRAILTQMAYQYLIPGLDLGVRIDATNGRVFRITGRVQMQAPGLPCLVCAEVLDSEQVRRDLLRESERRADPYIVGGAEPQPAVVSINATVASLGVTMFLSAMTGIPVKGRYQIYRGELGSIRNVSAEALPTCVICSKKGVLARGDQAIVPGWPE
jgi:molybdopterin/thiamine biosynthesis adenylyltransferase